MTNRERTRAMRGEPIAQPAGAAVPRRRSGRTLLFAFGGAALVAVAAIAVGIITRGGGGDATPATAGTAPIEGRAKGSATAPVTIIEYSDLQCPNCALFARTSERDIERQYIETGKVRLEIRQFAFLGNESVRAAEANECAGEQGKFWQYREMLYANQAGENRGAFSDKNLRNLALRAGLDGDALAACLDSGRYSDRVQLDQRTGRAAGVEGTPTFFIKRTEDPRSEQKIVGAQPLATFQAAIEQALAAAGAGR